MTEEKYRVAAVKAMREQNYLIAIALAIWALTWATAQVTRMFGS